MRNRLFFTYIASLCALLLLFCSGLSTASAHSACSISRIASITSGNDDGTETIFLDHNHLNAAPEKANTFLHQYRLRGVHRNLTPAALSAAGFRTRAVDAASLTAPPPYAAPDVLSPQHLYLFRLTPF